MGAASEEPIWSRHRFHAGSLPFLLSNDRNPAPLRTGAVTARHRSVLPGCDALVPEQLRSETEAKADGRLADAVGQGIESPTSCHSMQEAIDRSDRSGSGRNRPLPFDLVRPSLRPSRLSRSPAERWSRHCSRACRIYPPSWPHR